MHRPIPSHAHKRSESVVSRAHQPGTNPPHGYASGGLSHAVVRATGATDDGHGDPRVARETRPKNAAMYFYIRINEPPRKPRPSEEYKPCPRHPISRTSLTARC